MMTRPNLRPLATAMVLGCFALSGSACLSDEPTGLMRAEPAATTVKYDFFHKPLPEIPLPNDIATRYDATSPTKRRINASEIAPTFFERITRELIDELDGWGLYGPVAIPFTGPIDILALRDSHCDFADDDTTKTHCRFETDKSDDAIYLVDITPGSPTFGQLQDLDIGHGNFPLVLEEIGSYWENDPRGFTNTLVFEEADEDLNGNGRLDPGEDTDLDGVLDKPNYLPNHRPEMDDLRGRADAMMTFYERETNTLIARPMMPLRERTTYAVVITKRVLDERGNPVGSPFDFIHHTSQGKALAPLAEVLPSGTGLEDVAFAFTFTTQSGRSQWKVVRDGLYGHGVQQHIGQEFPAEMATLEAIKPESDQPYILYSEELVDALTLIATQVLGLDAASVEAQAIAESNRYVDYVTIGSFDSPQLFMREDTDGTPLSLNEQSWPNDLDRNPAELRAERVYYWVTMPRKEVSARGEGKPVPVVLLGHGYTSSRFEALGFAAHFAKHGIATVAMDCVSHGLGLSETDVQQVLDIIGLFGLRDFLEAVLKDRAFDHDGDGDKDSAADFWTSYLFHTRDVVRQSALDHMQLLRVLDTFDGTKTWAFDVDSDGSPDLAGDFDGDGNVDIGKDSVVSFTGGSLGGIMATVVGGVEPKVDAIAPIAGGAGLGDIGLRSIQGGVREAVILRLMGPVYTGTLDAETNDLVVKTVVPSLNRTGRVTLGSIGEVEPGDTFIAKNLGNGVTSCGRVAPDGTTRVSLESDKGHETVFEVYRGLAVETGSDCVLKSDAELVGTLSTFGEDVSFHTDTFAKGSPITAIAEGLGRPRATPSLRQTLMLAQVILDPADPGVYARSLLEEPITYDATGETTGAHAMFITTIGDMNVPASSGANMARAAGVIDYKNVDDRYGLTPNQVLIDTGMYEAVHTISRFDDSDGNPSHIDVENFSDAGDPWLGDVPRLDPPLRLFEKDALCDREDKTCGYSGAIFPFPRPGGEHGFALPGGFTDEGRERCRDRCTIDDGSNDPCGCRDLEVFDIGYFMLNAFSRYFATGGQEIDFDPCNANLTCDSLPEAPPARDIRDLR